MDSIDSKEVAIFGSGCFWCTEAVFKMIKGVVSVMPGYAGGKELARGEKPNYASIHSGTARQAEVLRIE